MWTLRNAGRVVLHAAVVLLLATSGSAAGQNITIEQVLEKLAKADAGAGNFCSDVTFASYDANGRAATAAKSGVRCYSKPDISVMCVTAAADTHERDGEVGRTIRTEINGKVVTTTIPDSFFLRDIRSMIAVHKGKVSFAGKTGGTHFVFEPGGQTVTAENRTGVYTIAIEAKGYEKAVLRVDVKSGTVLEKTVFSIPAGKQVSYESHSDFVKAGSSLLPKHTVYEYGGQKIIVNLDNYRVNLPIDIRSFAAGNGTCDDLAAAYSRSLHGGGVQTSGAKRPFQIRGTRQRR